MFEAIDYYLSATSVSLVSLAFLVCIAFIAGVVDTLAGGGGLLTVPALLISGLPPLQALGTNKLQGMVGTGTATLVLFRKRKIRWRQMRLLMLSAFIGSVLGTLAVQVVNAQLLSYLVPIILLLIIVYFVSYNPKKIIPADRKISPFSYTVFAIPAIGFYDGMFGPGTGSFYSLIGTSLRRLALVKATAMAKPLNFSTNIASFLVFLLLDQVVWVVGFAMMFGQVLGAWLGANFLYKINPIVLRSLVIVMCSGMLIRYLYSIVT